MAALPLTFTIPLILTFPRKGEGTHGEVVCID